MLRTLADREDARPVVLVYANGEWDRVAFREELGARPGTDVVHVLTNPPPGWSGETAS
jgi:ferredoxin-NADP reductase